MIAALLMAGAAALAEPAPARRVGDCGRTPVTQRIPVTAACAAAGAVVLGRVTLAVAGAMAGATAIHVLRVRRNASAERRRRAAAAAYLGAVSTNLQAGGGAGARRRDAHRPPSPHRCPVRATRA